MDRLIYVSMTGARHALEAQATVTHNLANVNSSGFRTQMNALRAVHLFGDGMPTRSYVVDSTVGTDFRPGTVQQTGRALDVAVMGKGFLAVQLPDGSEGYTRAGGLQQPVPTPQFAVFPSALVIRVSGDQQQRQRGLAVDHLFVSRIDLAPTAGLFERAAG